MVSSCGHDERGKYSGGQAGDQTGTEYYLRPFYVPSYGWDYVLRYPDKKVASVISDIAMKAAQNDKIGYDQSYPDRMSFWEQMKKAGYFPEKITTPCESDCSSSTSVVVASAGHRLGLTKLQQVSAYNTTRTLRDTLIKAGFECLTEKKYLTSDQYLLPGDIVLSEAHHVVINVSTGSKAVASAGTVTGGKKVTQYAGIVKVCSYLNVRTGPGTRFNTVLLGGVEFRLPSGMVVSIDSESNGFGRLTGTGYWVSLQYIQR